MTGTALLTSRISSAIAGLIAAFWMFWALLWGSAYLASISAAFTVLAVGLWWIGSTPELRDRRRNLIVGTSVTVVTLAIVGMFLSRGSG